jgi:hypothetical protein
VAHELEVEEPLVADVEGARDQVGDRGPDVPARLGVQRQRAGGLQLAVVAHQQVARVVEGGQRVLEVLLHLAAELLGLRLDLGEQGVALRGGRGLRRQPDCAREAAGDHAGFLLPGELGRVGEHLERAEEVPQRTPLGLVALVQPQRIDDLRCRRLDVVLRLDLLLHDLRAVDVDQAVDAVDPLELLHELRAHGAEVSR